jgi:hypothetical protein
MSYSLEVRLVNQTAGDVEIIAPKGTVFEGVKTAGNVMQNLAITRDYRVVLGPHVELTLHMEGKCINPSLSPPSGWPMRPTVFTRA